MAGSYEHILDEDGEIVGPERFLQRIENLGDAREMAVDMHRRIQRLQGDPELRVLDLNEDRTTPPPPYRYVVGEIEIEVWAFQPRLEGLATAFRTLADELEEGET